VGLSEELTEFEQKVMDEALILRRDELARTLYVRAFTTDTGNASYQSDAKDAIRVADIFEKALAAHKAAQ